MQTGTVNQKKLRVLIADDIQETRRNIRLMLSMNPNVLVVAIASNGEQAIEMAREHKPDVVIMDINMPGIDGLAAYEEITTFAPYTGCVVVSGEKHIAALGVAMQIGVQEYLVKPFTVDELLTAVTRVGTAVEAKRQEPESMVRVHPPEITPRRKLDQLADEYIKQRRTDQESLSVFEQLAQNPACEKRWLVFLAHLYAEHQQWGKLKTLAERMEQN